MQYSTTEFETLYIQCFPPSMRLALSLLHDEDEARDVVHEVFLKLWESDGKVDNPSAYILRSVRNTSLSRIRKLDVREKVKLKLMLEPPPDDFDYEQRNEEVKKAIERLLTSREQQVVEKIYTEGMSYKDAADSLGVSVAAINKNIVGALKKLRTHFKTGKS
ncbi:MAG: sigma-70 family RNA polymerase sigma factor [Muribaculaceae bacterium]|nr:sigma-70 family RNA polymerase sigma factor [Muribaculaceae bacterium]